MNRSREVLALANRYPGQISWHYDRAEIIADGVVHAAGVCLGLIGAVMLVVIAVRMERIEVTPILIYVIGLVAMLALSAAYNMWPVSSTKWVLRRFDHSAIYLLIAGTYTPFLTEMKNVLTSAALGCGVWLSAIIGIALKLALPGRFDRLAVVLCLLLGWSGVIAYDSHLPSRARACGFSQSAAFFIQSARSFMFGGACAFRTRSGTGSCCSPRVAIIQLSSFACRGHRGQLNEAVRVRRPLKIQFVEPNREVWSSARGWRAKIILSHARTRRRL
jgi:hemolysin III